MKGKLFAVILLTCLVLSSSVNASPALNINSQKALYSYIYRLASIIFDDISADATGEVNIVGGDADDYANGRTEESSKNDLINDAGRDKDEDRE